ncbi:MULTISPECIES: class I SAM-dependent methyltransferase [unclassified Mucilaginibacter]|uniref:class I SAM-dependent methyltransferase n=2 Tax=Mucilaginibacter TaxID=423349 RepID=UPI002B22FC87|nr:MULTISPECIES: class I SAM-dependent methyltransferase [unclassified Mucilaginibacter]MEB0248971.1 class I SAM-dependent methyltransferase [Mucilaginibacter sp. 5B2]MEB0262407.1 class I SAM-dependent methyltransferase [Mucilaginibacter sp. 10I4]MEB0277936.1 class I SAM-dependent methyltransferase [Mucilaginibacter sp. 10B2]
MGFVRKPSASNGTSGRTDKTTQLYLRLIYMTTNSTTRFSDRVNDYVKYRPGYPTLFIDFLQQQFGLDNDKLVADIGAGTGISTELFLNAGYHVIAVEPNEHMRNKAIELLGNWPGFKAQNGTAEDTGLATAGVDAVIAGQAFHWFDAEKTRAEFARILKPNGIIALIWNERKTGSAFEKEYDELIIKHGKDYVQADHRNIDAAHIAKFFAPQTYVLQTFYNEQIFDFDDVVGRLASSSYMPTKNDEGYENMLSDLKRLFDKYQQKGLITIQYDTNVYAGRINLT